MEINISDIPDFLKDSEFYRNLDLNYEELITIPILKMDDEVNDINDFKKLFKTLNFFDVDKFPKTFIKYYQNNSEEVFDSLDFDVYQELLIDLCNLKIKNYKQFFVTYKIITLYKLNPEEYDNYIDYALNKAHEVGRDQDIYLIHNKEYKDLVHKIYSTEILELEPYIFMRSCNSIHLRFKKKHLYGRWEISKPVLRREYIEKIIDGIKNNYEYEYYSIDKGNISYKNNEICIYCKYINEYLYVKINTYKIKINEFNKKIILEEFEKLIEWIDIQKIS
uniref:Uncharacterized protein n=1 Tax=viral metagenome TaxID=1070528 RepID=A0A6C0AE24_9ZZZZ